jgi:hypothetical protein
MADPRPRRVVKFDFHTEGVGKRTITFYDRPAVDDVYLFMVRRELFRLVTGVDSGDEIAQSFRDFIVKPRHVMG